jgi:WD40 repeat protein
MGFSSNTYLESTYYHLWFLHSLFLQNVCWQYCPSDPKKLMVTSGDSQVRILDGAHVISNYKGTDALFYFSFNFSKYLWPLSSHFCLPLSGLQSSSQVAASFTPDGDHIISASDDSRIYMWNYANQLAPITSRVKNVWSYERFVCNDVSVAVPWNAAQSRNSISLSCNIPSLRQEVPDDFCDIQDSTSHCRTEDSLDGDTVYQLPSGNFTLSRAFFAESAPRGSATWPEEQLPSNSAATSTLRKSQYKFLKASCQNAATHAWGQVIVSASWDGHIRSFQNYGLPVQVWHGTRHASYHHCSISGHPRNGASQVHGSCWCLKKPGWLELTLGQTYHYGTKCHMVGSCANMLVDHKLYVESSGPPRSRQRRRNCSRPGGETGSPCKIMQSMWGLCTNTWDVVVISLFRLLLGALGKYIERMNICFCQV